MNNAEIAEALVVSKRTVDSHINNILAKLQVANRTQAVLYVQAGVGRVARPA